MSAVQGAWRSTLAIAVALAGCTGSNAPQPAAVQVGTPASGVRGSGGGSGSSAAAIDCPATDPVPCGDFCCAAGLACIDGKCSESAEIATCPAGAVTCRGAPACAARTCTAPDSSGHGHDVSGASFGPGRFGSGLALTTDCGTPRIMTGAAGLPVGGAPFTIELFVRATGKKGTLLWWGDTASGAATHWLREETRTTSTTGGSGGRQYAALILDGCEGVGVAADGQWHAVAVTEAAGEARLYVDGGLARQCAVGASAAAAVAIGFGNVAGSVTATCDPFAGAIDEVRILDHALTTAEIEDAFARADPPQVVAGTVGLWHFDEGGGDFCCPAGSSCGTGRRCDAPSGPAPTCPSATPVACDDGRCCPAGTTCVAGGCKTPGNPATCPTDAPVVCGDGTCCPSGRTCLSGACVVSPRRRPDVSCMAGEVGSVWDSGSGRQLLCCPPVPGRVVSTSCAELPGCLFETDAGCACPEGWSCRFACNHYQCYRGADSSNCPADRVCEDGPAGAGCCNFGQTCTAPGRCCPAGQVSCGDGCCPPDHCSDGSCVSPAPPLGCPGGATLCGAACCGAGSICYAGECHSTAPAGYACGNGILCGTICCGNGTICARPGLCEHRVFDAPCPPNLPSSCGPGSGCCREGFTCGGSTQGTSGYVCIGTTTARRPPRPEGSVSCPDGSTCAAGESCGTAGRCCPGGHPVGCGGQCCLAGAACTGGECGCPSDLPVDCGATCCSEGAACEHGKCVASCDGPHGGRVPACGGLCCAGDHPCTNGACSCPDDHPSLCGGQCCLEGAPCANGACGCPDARVRCGAQCCGVDQECEGGGCVTPSSGGGKTCPDGHPCSDPGHICCDQGGHYACLLPGLCQ